MSDVWMAISDVAELSLAIVVVVMVSGRSDLPMPLADAAFVDAWAVGAELWWPLLIRYISLPASGAVALTWLNSRIQYAV